MVYKTAVKPMNAFVKLSKIDDTEKIRNALLEYGKLETLAMVRILEKLKEI